MLQVRLPFETNKEVAALWARFTTIQRFGQLVFPTKMPRYNRNAAI
jgi:hypothetical protein